MSLNFNLNGTMLYEVKRYKYDVGNKSFADIQVLDMLNGTFVCQAVLLATGKKIASRKSFNSLEESLQDIVKLVEEEIKDIEMVKSVHNTVNYKKNDILESIELDLLLAYFNYEMNGEKPSMSMFSLDDRYGTEKIQKLMFHLLKLKDMDFIKFLVEKPYNYGGRNHIDYGNNALEIYWDKIEITSEGILYLQIKNLI